MAFTIRRAAYFYATGSDRPGDPSGLLTGLADRGVNLLAFTAVPLGPGHTQYTIFPADPGKLVAEAGRAGLAVDGPHPALLVQGDDELGALARVHATLSAADIDVFASTGVADGRGSFGYVVYVRPADFDRAAAALNL